MSVAARAQPVSTAPVANQEPGKPTHHAVELIDYAGPYEFPKSMPLTIVAQDGQLYERCGSDGFLKIEATGPDEYVVPKYLVYFTFRRSNGKISSVSVSHSDDSVAVRTAKPIPATAFTSNVTEERYGGIYAFVGDEDESDLCQSSQGTARYDGRCKRWPALRKAVFQELHSLNASRITDRPESFSYLGAELCFESGDGKRIIGLHMSFPGMGQGNFRFVRRATDD